MFIIQKHKPATVLARFSPLRHLLFISVLSFLAYASTAAADTYSISNETEVPVRSGQGTEFKIVSLLQNGEAVVSLEEDGYWIKVRTATGREGWMLKRYLSSAPSVDDTSSLPTSNNESKEQAEKTSPMTEQAPNALQPETNVIPETLQAPQPESTNLPQFQEHQKEQDQDLEELKNKLAAVTMENKVLREDERIKWFLAGGGMFFFGWIIGLITCRTRKRKPSLL